MAGEEGEDGEEEGVAPGRRLAWSQTDYADSLPASVTSWKGLLPAAAASTRSAARQRSRGGIGSVVGRPARLFCT